ncbi:malate dehydrogenase [Candidatus Riflebacteria bacterium]
MSKLIKVAVTGTAGQICYSLLPRLASGEVFGPDTKIVLHLLEVGPALKPLEGVVMEMDDCAFPLLQKMVITDDAEEAFDGINYAILVGSKPRGKGMERGDLIRDNGPIFVTQGKALAAKAADDVKIVVVGNPANTNCLIAMYNASGIPRERFSSLMRLDQNRAKAQLAGKAGVPITEVTNMTVWGNHSATQYPDAYNAKISGKPANEVINDEAWLNNEFLTTVQKRGAAIIQARGKSSAMSAANATVDHIISMENPTPEGEWFAAGIPSDGSYGIDDGLLFSFPLRSTGNGNYKIVQGLPWNDFAKEKIQLTLEELRKEKDIVKDLLG